MSRSPDDEKRRRILEAAFAEFSRHGYRNTTIKTIADQADIAAGSVYTYFADKDALFQATIISIWDRFIAAIDQARQAPGDYKTRFIGLFDQAGQLADSSQSLLLGMFSQASRRKLLSKNLDRATAALLPFFSEGAAAGYPLPAGNGEEARFSLRVLIAGALFELAIAGEEEKQQIIQRLRHLLLRTFFREA